MQKIVGKVAFTPKGNWEYALHYEKLDVVEHNNTLYIALKEVPSGTDIDNKEYWQKSINGMGGKVQTDIEMSDTSENPVQNKVIKAYVDNHTIDLDSEMSDTSENAVQNKVIKSYVDNHTVTMDSEMSDTSENGVQNKVIKSYVDEIADDKVEKVDGKTLTSNDFTDILKAKLDGIAEGATNVELIEKTRADYEALTPEQKNDPNKAYFITNSGSSTNVIDSSMSDTSENPVMNKVIKGYVDDVSKYIEVGACVSVADMSNVSIKLYDNPKLKRCKLLGVGISNGISANREIGFTCSGFKNEYLPLGYVYNYCVARSNNVNYMYCLLKNNTNSYIAFENGNVAIPAGTEIRFDLEWSYDK